MKYDGVAFLNGTACPPRANTPCINADLTVIAWTPALGIHEIGRGTTLDSARAIARLHASHDDYIHFEEPVTVLLRTR